MFLMHYNSNFGLHMKLLMFQCVVYLLLMFVVLIIMIDVCKEHCRVWKVLPLARV